jgi:dihydrofolate reductase
LGPRPFVTEMKTDTVDHPEGEMIMRRIVLTEFVSLDGFMDEPRWTFDFDRGADGDKFKLDELFGSEAMLLGRVTYQHFAQAWPSMTDEEGFADRMNNMPKYVVSSTLTDDEATWGPTTVIKGDELTRLKQEPGGDLLVAGSHTLAQSLIRNALVDEYRLMVFPILLAGQQPLFPADLAGHLKLTLAGQATVGDGILLLTYHPKTAG